ncbi:MAG: hypothetical protein E6L09_13745 [Verrucomicrobia bacterium]|nr:MAG: hypothetical protein E6L09_13745 [Verrucomicrobiota bacterium]
MNPPEAPASTGSAADRARHVRDRRPEGGLFADMDWRISPAPFPLGNDLAQELETLGRVLLQFNRAVNLLYRQSVAGKQPPWVAAWLDRGKPARLIELQRSAAFKNDLPRVIRPDLLLTDQGLALTELDSVPGGIGLTAWLNQTYARIGDAVLGEEDGMLLGFAGIFGDAPAVHVVVSREAETYRPEMDWICRELDARGHRVVLRDEKPFKFADGDAVYRFFELFDLSNVPAAGGLFAAALNKRILLTPPPKPIFEEKMLFALLWNRNLREFWRRELGEGFLKRLLKLVPYTWVVDPTPLPPQAVIPELNLTDWQQLKALSQKERELIVKISGFSEHAWGARSVYLGSDLSHADWSAAIDAALAGFERSPCVLQRYHKPKVVQSHYFDFTGDRLVAMPGRVRLCPYYFLVGEGDAARARLGGALATICPADKKIIHGMRDAILAPCAP